MKKVEAFIRPLALRAVKTRLQSLGISGATVGEVDTVTAAEAGSTPAARSRRKRPDVSSATVRMEIVVKNAMVREVVRVLIEASRAAGDREGRIFVNGVDDAFRIRTSERGTDAISL